MRRIKTISQSQMLTIKTWQIIFCWEYLLNRIEYIDIMTESRHAQTDIKKSSTILETLMSGTHSNTKMSKSIKILVLV